MSENNIDPSLLPARPSDGSMTWKTIALGMGLFLFLLLNVCLVFNASSLMPDERTKRLLLFSLKPEFWPNWYAQALWMLAGGLVLSKILTNPSIQGRLEAWAKAPLFFKFSVPKPELKWLESLKKYPVERILISFMEKLLYRIGSVFRPKYFPALILGLAVFGTVLLAYTHLSPASPWSFLSTGTLYQLAVIILAIPLWLGSYFIVTPLAHLANDGVFSWKVPIAVILPFGLCMVFYLYGRKIKKFLVQDEIKPLAIRYFLIVTVIYAAFLPSLNRLFRGHYLDLNDIGFSGFYEHFIWHPFYAFLLQGELTWRFFSYITGVIVFATIPFLVFRRFLYAADRSAWLQRQFRFWAVPLLLFVCYFWSALFFVLKTFQSGFSFIYQRILLIPAQVWDCIYFAPCYFLYFSEASWKLLVGPIVFVLFVAGYCARPFQRLGERAGFSPNIFYCLFWTILLCCCFFVTIWKLLLLAGMVLLAYHVAVRDFHMTGIRWTPPPYEKILAYRLLIVTLVLFDIFIVSLSCVLIYYYFKRDFHSCLYLPLIDLCCGRMTWKLIFPAGVLLLYLSATGYLVFIRYRTKTDSQKSKRHETLQKKLFFGSLLAILVVLNVLCFIGLYSTGAGAVLTDIRFWPWWAMIIPVSLLVFSVSGLLLTRKRIVPAVILLCAVGCFHGGVNAAESRFTLLEPAKFVSEKDARQAATRESIAVGSGYYADPQIVDCFAAMEYRYTGGRYENKPIPFRLRCPQAVEPGKKYPLIVWFHGRGESGDDNSRQLAHLQIAMEFFAGKNQRDFFVLATQCPGDNNQWTRSLEPEGKGDAPMTIAGEIMEALLQEYPIDPNRLSACGFSSGGTGAWEFGRKSPRRLAALGACSGNPVKAATPEEYLGPAIWAFNNIGDAGVSSEEATLFIEAINSGGGNAFLSLYDQSGHNSWTKAMREEKIIGWLILQSLEKQGPPQGIICRPLSQTSQFALFGLPVLIIVSSVVLPLLRRRRPS